MDVPSICDLGLHHRLGEHRNGYPPRRWDTRAGTIELQIPKLRQGSYFPVLPEPRRRAERALLSVGRIRVTGTSAMGRLPGRL